MRYRPLRSEALVIEVADRISARPAEGWTRVLVDGAPPAGPACLADALVDPVQVRGRPAVRVSAADFLRPASLRLEHGRTNPDARYHDWLDVAALRREVLDPLGPGGSGRLLPSLWDVVTDRATRAEYRSLPVGGVVLIDGELLLGRGLPAELTVHLAMSPAALSRRLADDEQWAIPAFTRYDAEIDPLSVADIGVRVDDPRHPAVLERDHA